MARHFLGEHKMQMVDLDREAKDPDLAPAGLEGDEALELLGDDGVVDELDAPRAAELDLDGLEGSKTPGTRGHGTLQLLSLEGRKVDARRRAARTSTSPAECLVLA